MVGVVCDAVARVQVTVGSAAAELGDKGALVSEEGELDGRRSEERRVGKECPRSWDCQGGRGAPTRRRSGIVVRGETCSSAAALQRMSMSRPDLLRIRKGLEAMLDIIAERESVRDSECD